MPNRRGKIVRESQAVAFAALGDESRLRIVSKLCEDSPQSISQLTEGSELSRQAVTKHLRILQDAGIVESVRAGRENLFELNSVPLTDMQKYLNRISERWDEKLANLKNFVES